MMTLSFEALYRSCLACHSETITPLDVLLMAFFEGKDADDGDVEALKSVPPNDDGGMAMQPDCTLKTFFLRRYCAASFFADEGMVSDASKVFLEKELSYYMSLPLRGICQLASGITTLATRNTEGRADLLSSVLSSGAASLDVHGLLSKDLVFPRPYLHAELGVVWALLGVMYEDNNLLVKAERLAEWQKKYTLDHRGYPSESLFSREREVSKAHLIAADALLFYVVGKAISRQDMLDLSYKLLEYLEPLWREEHKEFFSYATTLSLWVDRLTERFTVRSSLQHEEAFYGPIYDSQTLIAGMRTEKSTAVCLGRGYNTGLGALSFGDVAVVNYGPQLMPLGDMRSFGVDSPIHEDLDDEDTCITNNEGVHLIRKAMPIFSSEGESSGVWCDVEQSYVDEVLSLSVYPYADDGEKKCSFVFFLSGEECIVGDKVIMADNLEKYRGKVSSVHVRGRYSVVEILSEGFAGGEMQVIPLAGGDNFWGANFLVAYSMPLSSHTFSWKVKQCL
jgi:hypothetical protein